MKVQIFRLLCKCCGHTWVPKIEDVRICPKCKNARWDVGKKKDRK